MLSILDSNNKASSNVSSEEQQHETPKFQLENPK